MVILTNYQLLDSIECTGLNFQDFSVLQILRETDFGEFTFRRSNIAVLATFGEFRRSKIAVFANFGALNFVDLINFLSFS